MGGLLHMVQRGGPGPGRAAASVLITALLYNGMLLCDFNVPIKGLNDLMRNAQ